jgi:hypothetical protein
MVATLVTFHAHIGRPADYRIWPARVLRVHLARSQSHAREGLPSASLDQQGQVEADLGVGERLLRSTHGVPYFVVTEMRELAPKPLRYVRAQRRYFAADRVVEVHRVLTLHHGPQANAHLARN